MGTEEVALIGLTCNLIGIFFLANSVMFRRPRKVMEEVLGSGLRSLDAIKDYVLNKIQVVIGFLFLVVGLVLQGIRAWSVSQNPVLAVVVCLGLLVFAATLYAVGSLYSRRTFQHVIREFFAQHGDWDFKGNMGLAKEIGSVLGVRHGSEESVDDFLSKLRVALHIPGQQPTVAPVSERTRRLREMAPVSPMVATDRGR